MKNLVKNGKGMIKKPKKIGIIAPFFLPIPPKRHGGTEWVTYHQANGLKALGYNVSLFACAGSKTSAKLITMAQTGVSEYKIKPNEMESSRLLRLETSLLAKTSSYINTHQKKFDIIFTNSRGSEYLAVLAKHWKMPVVHILHLPLFKEAAEVYRENNTPLVSIGMHQQKSFPQLNYVGNIYNCVDTKKFYPIKNPALDYALMVTTIGEHKNTLAGIQACLKANTKLVIAGKIRDQAYFIKKIKPLIDGKKIRYVGEIGLTEKITLYQNAKAFLMPVQWAEPFGLVMIEAMACGTPVIGYDHGAVREVVETGKTGFIVSNVNGLAQAIKKIDTINREVCRTRTEKLFSVERMTKDYAMVVEKLTS